MGVIYLKKWRYGFEILVLMSRYSFLVIEKICESSEMKQNWQRRLEQKKTKKCLINSAQLKLNSMYSNVCSLVKGLVHFKLKCPYYLLTPMSPHKVYVFSFFSRKRKEGFWWKQFQDFYPLVSFNGLPNWLEVKMTVSVQLQRDYKWYQTMNKGFINRNYYVKL